MKRRSSEPKRRKRDAVETDGKKGKTVRRLLKALLIAALLVALLSVGMNCAVIFTSRDGFTKTDELDGRRYDCILVLGAGLTADGTPSSMLQERLDFAIDAYNAGCTDRLLMSGDHGSDDHDEVHAMKRYAAAHGVPENCILMDHAGFSTYESMYRARDIFGCKKILIVTQKYHLYRAIYDARRLGLEADGVASDKFIYHPLLIAKNNGREFLARCKDIIWCILQPEPTYLGEAIPIASDGSATED